MFAPDPAGVPAARQLVCRWLATRGLAALRPRLELVASELFTNAVTHGRGVVRMRLTHRPDCVRLEVEDHGGGQPVLRPPSPMGGWGLRLVDQLADAWGTDVADGQTIVWAEHVLPATDH